LAERPCAQIMQAFNLHNSAELIRFAIKQGLAAT
jgi:hypothetical protein